MKSQYSITAPHQPAGTFSLLPTYSGGMTRFPVRAFILLEEHCSRCRCSQLRPSRCTLSLRRLRAAKSFSGPLRLSTAHCLLRLPMMDAIWKSSNRSSRMMWSFTTIKGIDGGQSNSNGAGQESLRNRPPGTGCRDAEGVSDARLRRR
jgi:hypothetical protein